MKYILWFFAVLFFAVIFSIIFAYPFMWLWNWLMPAVFGLPSLTLKQAWVFMIICKMIFPSNYNYNSK